MKPLSNSIKSYLKIIRKIVEATDTKVFQNKTYS